MWIKNSLATAWLAAKESAGVTPDMNLKNPLQAGDKACLRVMHLGFETQGICYQKFKKGVSVTPQK